MANYRSKARPSRYSVGHGRPPLRTRWKKGQSGNPKGRPKGSRNLRALLGEALGKKVTVQKDGRSKELTYRESVVQAALARAAKGDVKMLHLIFEIEAENPETVPNPHRSIADMDPNEAAETYLRLVRAAADGRAY